MWKELQDSITIDNRLAMVAGPKPRLPKSLRPAQILICLLKLMLTPRWQGREALPRVPVARARTVLDGISYMIVPAPAVGSVLKTG